MKTLLAKKTVLVYVNICMVLFLTAIINNTYGLGPCPSVPCGQPIYDSNGRFIRCVGCGENDCDRSCINNSCQPCGGDTTKNCCGDGVHCCPAGKYCCGANDDCYDDTVQVCCGGAPHDRGGCMECINDAWVYTCRSDEHCSNHGGTPTCRCNNCYFPDTVPASTTPPSCPPCSDFIYGCDGMQDVITGYYRWRTANYLEGGWCKNPEKTDTVGHTYFCAGDWNYGNLIKCAGEAGVCASACSGVSTPLQAIACLGCLAVAGVDCVRDGACAFISHCGPNPDPAFAIPITKTVVDWGADCGNLCIGGL